MSAHGEPETEMLWILFYLQIMFLHANLFHISPAICVLKHRQKLAETLAWQV